MPNTLATQSSRDPYKVNSLVLGPRTDPVSAVVRWDPVRSIWNGTILCAAVVLAPFYATWSAFLVFLILSAVTLCSGHSVGYHRRLVHRSFKCSKSVERLLVWMGAAVLTTRAIGRSVNLIAMTFSRTAAGF
jgi:hypothetical protein